MTNTPDPRDFYRVTRAVLMPSLCLESFARIPAEAMLNGIPVLASDRGALSETLAEGGYTFGIPERLTPQTRTYPTPEEVRPWLETIERLWDNSALYMEEGRRCLRAAAAWRPEQLLPRFEIFFADVANGRVTAPLATPDSIGAERSKETKI
jgi:glycosyltransferase involved in cell wall biosynthesis